MIRPKIQNGTQAATLIVSPPKEFKPFRDRAIAVRSAPCPTCDAKPGEICLGVTTGRPLSKTNGSHNTRRRRAIQLQNLA